MPKPLSKSEIQEHLNTLRVAVDPKSPFFGMVSFDDLLDLPVPQQYQIHDAMDPALTELVNNYKSNMEAAGKA
jgi:hypothetical protein